MRELSPPQDHSLPHYTPRSLAQELDQADQAQALEIYRKTLSCIVCRRAFQELRQWLIALGHDYPRVALEYTERHQLFDLLFDLNRKERFDRVRSDEMFHHWGLATLVLSNARDTLPHHPEIALDLALLALAIAENLPLESYGLQWVLDLEGQIHTQVFECYLKLRNTEMAKQSLQRAGEAFCHLLHRPDLAAKLDYQEARLSLLLGDEGRALSLLERALGGVLYHLQKPSQPANPWEFAA